jgi:hypothetical protein
LSAIRAEGKLVSWSLVTVPLNPTELSSTHLPRSIRELSGPGKSHRWGPAVCLALLSVAYLVPTCIRAASEKLWFDEIYTFDAVALLPSLRTFWSALKQVEATPPLGFVLAAGSESIFGRNELGVRFPSIIAFWIMALCLYLYLSRRLPRPIAIAAMLLTVLTAAGRYSYEARPYALMLSLAGIALVAWQAAAEGRGRPAALVTLGAALAGALCSHAMAVTLALPFLAGEVTRTVQRKRVDWPVWCAFASATPALLFLWKLKAAADLTVYRHSSGSLPWQIIATYLQMLRPAIAPLGLAVLSVLALRIERRSTANRAPVMRAYEMAALAGFALIPFAAVPISSLADRYWLRYSLNCTIGLAGLLAILLFRIGRSTRLSGVAVMAVFGVSFVIGQVLPENRRPDNGLKIVNSSGEIQPFLEQIPPDAPIVICSDLTFVELEHYSSQQTAARLYYLTDRAAAAAIDGDTLFEVRGALLGEFFPFRAHFADYHSFIATHKRFYVVRPIRNIVREYLAGRISLQPRETAGHFQYYEASTR